MPRFTYIYTRIADNKKKIKEKTYQAHAQTRSLCTRRLQVYNIGTYTLRYILYDCGAVARVQVSTTSVRP